MVDWLNPKAASAEVESGSEKIVSETEAETADDDGKRKKKKVGFRDRKVSKIYCAIFHWF